MGADMMFKVIAGEREKIMIAKEYQTIRPRIVARVIDGSIFGAAFLAVSLLFMVMGLLINDFLEIIFYILFPIYNAWFLYYYGQTLGKYVMKLKVIAEDEKQISFWRALEREIIILVPFTFSKILNWLNLAINHKVSLLLETSILIVFFAVLAKDEKRRSYHDLAVKTVVVKALG
ncbi:MAG TPA: hypothetical protein DDW65_00810 [Firmicutes bacterium]|nr:hypothetical protein [Bacillota bacterium]